MTFCKKTLLFLCLSFVLLLNAGFVLALEVHYPDILGQSINDTSTLPEYVCYLFGLGMALALFIAVIVIAFGGIYYLVSYGRGKFTSEAKDWIKAGILGLLIIACASLIAYTINPNLTTCKLAFLPQIDFNASSSPTVPPTAGIANFKEIPIGTLTETLLTRTMDCYGFNQWGDPVDGDQITTDDNKKMAGPTYLKNDRADCLVQLIDGAQKKSQVVAALSDEITKLMNECDCLKYGQCDDTCNGQCNQPPGNCPVGYKCTGACVGAGCTPPKTFKPPDCCPTDSKVPDPKNPGKNLSVKDLIEHGLIDVSVGLGNASGEDCKTPDVKYNGLDEFRCPNPIPGGHQSCDDIKSFVEKQVQVNKQTITLMQKDNWNQLNMLQQLMYFKEKIDELKQKIQDDKNVLNQAKSVLSNPKCYLAIPYIDLLKTYQATDQQQKVILTYKAFSDPQTGKNVNASNYCTGFNYNNSSCLKKCNDVCPDTSPGAVQLYKQKTANCASNDRNCLEKAIEDAYNQRPCPYAADPSKTKTFGGCISSCQQDCVSGCAEKYLSCTNEYDLCESQCNNNSQCVLDNAGSCLFGAQGFKDCLTQISSQDQGNINYCINNAYTCKNGSDQNAGYPDCTVPPSNKCPAQKYSSSFLYDNLNCQKCPDPYFSWVPNGPTCQELYPETTKCPTASNCPDCSCDQIDQTLKFSIPNKSNKDNAGDEGYTTSSGNVSAHQIVGPQCNGYSYNDDPLTFYCQDDWWDDSNKEGTSATPIGAERICPKEGEVPVGQTVDDAENWATGLINSANKMNKDIQQMITQMTTIGSAYKTSPILNYCKCDAKFDLTTPRTSPNAPGGPICKTDCGYSTWWENVLDANGDYVDILKCACAPTPCQGSPCQQITDYLSVLWNNYRQLKIDFADFYTTMLQEPRSDIMKELTYSRQTTNDCSLVNSAYGSDDRLLNCTRVEHEEISPISTGQTTFNNTTMKGCYGGQENGHLGKIFNLTDNWFCCQEYQKNPAPSNNPIYNITN